MGGAPKVAADGAAPNRNPPPPPPPKPPPAPTDGVAAPPPKLLFPKLTAAVLLPKPLSDVELVESAILSDGEFIIIGDSLRVGC
jgi:hypothetical protein